jgi:autotransporter translocation and assembly factor TamB
MIRRLIKIVLWILASLLALVGLLVTLALWSPVQTRVAHWALNKVNGTLAGQISVQRIHLQLNGTIDLRNLRLVDSDQQLVLSIDRLQARIRLRELQQRHLHLTSLRVEGLQTNLTLDSTGSNLQRAVSPRVKAAPTKPSGSTPLAWQIDLDKLMVQAATTHLAVNGAPLWDTDHWSLNATAHLRQDSLSYDLKMDARPDLELATEGRMVLWPTLIPLQGLLSASVDSLLLSRIHPQAGLAGNVNVSAGFLMRGDSLQFTSRTVGSSVGEIQLNGVTPYPLSHLAGHGELTLTNVTPARFWNDSSRMKVNGTILFSKSVDVSLLNGWTADLALRNSSYGPYALVSAGFHLQTRDSMASLTGGFDTGQGRLDLSVQARGFDPKTARLTADVTMHHVNLHALVPQVPDSLSPLTGHMLVHVKNLDLQNPVADAQLAFSSFHYGLYRVDTLALIAAVDHRRIQLDTLFIVSNPGHLRAKASGEWQGLVHYAVIGSIPDISAYRSYLPASLLADADTLQGAIQLDLHGTANLATARPSGITAAGKLWLDSLQFRSYKVTYAALDIVEADLDSLRFTSTLSVHGIAAAGQVVDSLRGTFSGTPGDIAADFRVWARADTISLGGDVRIRRSPSQIDLTLDSLFGTVYGITFDLNRPAQIALSGRRVEVDNLIISSNVGLLRAEGTVQKGGQQNVSIDLSDISTGAVGQLIHRDLPQSTINLSVQVTGPDTAIVGEISFSADSVRLKDYPLADRIVLHAAMDGRHTVMNGLVIWTGDTTLLFDGTMPARISLEKGFELERTGPIEGHMQLREQPLAKINQYMPPGVRVDGFVSSDAHFAGSVEKPQWKGTFAIRDGEYTDPRAGIRYQKMVINGELDGDTLRIPNFNIKSVGTLTGHGTALMGFPLPKELDLSLNFDRFQAVNSAVMRARASGKLAITGKLNRLNAVGDIRLDEALYRLTGAAGKNIEPIDLNTELARLGGDTTKSAFSPDQIYRSMSHEIHLDIPGNTWIRGRGLNIELNGELYTFKQPFDEPAISGQIAVQNGSISIVNTEFRVVNGSVRFDGSLFDPAMDIYAYEPRLFNQSRDSVTVHVSGSLKYTRFELGGTDAAGQVMTANQAASKLVLGAMGVNSGSGNGQPSALDAAATSAATGQITGALGKLAGVDMLRFNTGESGFQGLAAGSLEVGTYVTDRLFIRVVQPVQATLGKEDVSVEYRLFRWLTIRAQQNQQISSAFDLLMQIDWR